MSLGTSIVCLAAVLPSCFNLAQFSSVFLLVKATFSKRLESSFWKATAMPGLLIFRTFLPWDLPLSVHLKTYLWSEEKMVCWTFSTSNCSVDMKVMQDMFSADDKICLMPVLRSWIHPSGFVKLFSWKNVLELDRLCWEHSASRSLPFEFSWSIACWPIIPAHAVWFEPAHTLRSPRRISLSRCV